MAKKTSMCVCPKCGGDDIEYLDLDYEGDYVIHKCLCNDCDASFTEYEALSYVGYAYEDIDYDSDGNVMD